MKRTILTLLALASISAHCQPVFNRYGLELTATDEGFRLKDRELILRLGLFDPDDGPQDMHLPYVHTDKLLTGNYLDGCTTVRTVYKSYPGYELEMEVDLPPGGAGPHPFMVWIHGGGWEAGNLHGMSHQSRFLASNGIAGVRISYSLIPQGGTMARAWEDIRDALQFIKSNAAGWNLDTGRFGFGGHSAGAHLAAYAAVRTPGTRLLIAVNGPYDINNIMPGFEPGEHHMPFLGRTPHERALSSPVNFVEPSPDLFCLLAYSSGDFLIDPGQADLFASKLRENGIRYELITADYYSHGSYLTGDLYEAGLLKFLLTAIRELQLP